MNDEKDWLPERLEEHWRCPVCGDMAINFAITNRVVGCATCSTMYRYTFPPISVLQEIGDKKQAYLDRLFGDENKEAS